MAVPNSQERQKTELDQALSASRGVFAAVGLFSFFINALMLTVPLYMLQIYDRVLVSRSEQTLLLLTLVAAGLLVALGVLELTRSRVLVRIGARLDSALTAPLLVLSTWRQIADNIPMNSLTKLSRLSVSARDNQSHGVALPQVYLELAGHRRPTG